MGSEPSGTPPDPLLIPGPEREAAIARMVFDVLDAGVIVQGPKGRIATANPAAADLFGVTLEAMIEARLGDLPGRLLRPDGSDLPPAEQPAQVAVRTGSAQLDVLIGLDVPGRARRWLEVSSQPLVWDGKVFAVVSAIRDVTERRDAEEALAHQARHDPVTGLPNRRYLMDRLGVALTRAERTGRPVALLFSDVDHFKLVNDSLGHHVGDAVLQQVANRLRSGARSRDTVVRFGGDEFVIVCEDVDDEHAALELTERLVRTLDHPVVVEQDQRVVTISVGVAVSRTGDTPASLVRDADIAMNRAKELGRARIEVFSDELRHDAVRRLDLDTALRRAVERDELHLAYQPIVTVEGLRPVGVEALLRWSSPDHGSVTPTEFIPLAERSGIIGPIGRWVIEQAIATVAYWRRLGVVPTDFWVSVNISARQLGDTALVALISDSLAESELDPGCLHLEVTESTLIDDLTTTIERLDELKALGVQIDVDDFGTGYSSLAYLKRLPLDTLKIDRSFTSGLGTDPHDTSIVHAIVSLGHALDLSIVAEGVETAGQLDALRELGCDLAQGFHWCAPLAAPELLDWLGAATA